MWIRFVLRFLYSCVFFVCVLLSLAMLCVTDKNNDLSVSFSFTQSYLLNTHTQLVRHLFHFFVCVHVDVWVRVCSFCAKRFRKNSKHQVKNNKQKQSGGQTEVENKKSNQEKNDTTICYQFEHKFSHCDIPPPHALSSLQPISLHVSFCWFHSFGCVSADIFFSLLSIQKRTPTLLLCYVLLFGSLKTIYLGAFVVCVSVSASFKIRYARDMRMNG